MQMKKVRIIKKKMKHCPECLRFLDWYGKEKTYCRCGIIYEIKKEKK